MTIKKLTFKLLLISTTFIVSSCGGSGGGSNMQNCIEGMMDEGYSYTEAVEACEEAQRESNIR